MKKIKFIVLGLLCAVLLPNMVNANVTDNTPINVHLFKSSTCSHCEEALKFFGELSNNSEYSKFFKLISYETNGSSQEIKDNIALAEKVAKHYGETFDGVPLIIIGDTKFDGYAASMDDKIKNAIKTSFNKEPVVDTVTDIKNGTVKKDSFGTVIAIGVIAVLVAGIGYFIYIARKTTSDEEEVLETKDEIIPTVLKEKKEIDEKAKQTPSEEPKKVVKKTTTKKKTTAKKTAAKKATSTKTSASKSVKTVKKTTTKKPTTKKTTK